MVNELKPRKFDIVALQEMCLRGSKSWKNDALDATFFQSGGADNKLGTGFVVLGKMRDRVMDWEAISDRLCRLRIKGRFFNYHIFNVHCPHEKAPDHDKEAFYAKLEEHFDSCPQRDVKIVIGDINARFGSEEMYKPVIGSESLHADDETNDNGQRCINFAASRGMVVRSTFFPRKRIHKATYISPRKQETQIDHVLIDRRFFSDVQNIRTYRGADIHSDHFLVGASMRSKLSTAYHQRRSRQPATFNTERLQSAKVAQNYVQQLEASLPTEEELGAASLNDGWSSIRSAIGSAADTTLGSRVRVSKNRWFDDECQRLVNEKKAAYARKLHPGSEEDEERCRRARNQQVAVFKLKKRQQEDRDCAEMEQLYRQNETRKFYEKVNQTRKGCAPQAETCRDTEGNLLMDKGEVLNRWRQFFDEHLNGDVAHGDGTETQLGVPEADERFPAPDLETVRKEIRKLRNNRAAGKDRLPGELFKYGGEKLARALKVVISKI